MDDLEMEKKFGKKIPDVAKEIFGVKGLDELSHIIILADTTELKITRSIKFADWMPVKTTNEAFPVFDHKLLKSVSDKDKITGLKAFVATTQIMIDTLKRITKELECSQTYSSAVYHKLHPEEK